MGIFTRKPDLDTPAGVVSFFLRNDDDSIVQLFRGEAKLLTAEVEADWEGRSRAERLDSLRGSFRFFLTFQETDPPLEELPADVQGAVVLAGAKTRILGFMWERVYGESMQHLSASWGPLTKEELDGVRPASTDEAQGYGQVADALAADILELPDDIVQPADKVMLPASLRAGARVADRLATEGVDHDPVDDAAVGRLLSEIAQRGDSAAMARIVGVLGWHFVLRFIEPFREGLEGDGTVWARGIGMTLLPYEDVQMDLDWVEGSYQRAAAYEPGSSEEVSRYYLWWARGLLKACGLSDDEAGERTLILSLRLPIYAVDEMEGWKTELRGAGLVD